MGERNVSIRYKPAGAVQLLDEWLGSFRTFDWDISEGMTRRKEWTSP
jgi:hypothetical protein